MMHKKIIIAIDGPSASGKGTLSDSLSKKLNIPNLNTGGLYRGVAYKALAEGIDLNDEAKIIGVAKKLEKKDIENPNIFTEDVGGKASVVAKMQSVRDVLLKYQRDFADNPCGAILEGRDIGTFICPNADYKFFVTASPEERAKRRFKEMQEKGQNTSYEEIFKKIKERDEKDMNREASPFRKADDAVLIDTTGKTIEEVFLEVLSYIK